MLKLIKPLFNKRSCSHERNQLEEQKEKAIALVNAYFDKKDIVMKDPDMGVENWVSVRHPDYWSWLTQFCKNVDKYKII